LTNGCQLMNLVFFWDFMTPRNAAASKWQDKKKNLQDNV